METTAEPPKLAPKSRKGHVSVAKAAEYFGCSSKTIIRRIRRGDLEGFKWSPSYQTVSWSSVFAFEDAHRISQAPLKFRKCAGNS